MDGEENSSKETTNELALMSDPKGKTGVMSSYCRNDVIIQHDCKSDAISKQRDVIILH